MGAMSGALQHGMAAFPTLYIGFFLEALREPSGRPGASSPYDGSHTISRSPLDSLAWRSMLLPMMCSISCEALAQG